MLVEIDALSVGQLYLDQNKIEKNGQLLRAAQFEGYPPIEVYEIFPGQLTILDGNSRCYLLYLAGKKEVEVTFAATEEVETMIMRPLYEACLRWCQKSGCVSHCRFVPANPSNQCLHGKMGGQMSADDCSFTGLPRRL